MRKPKGLTAAQKGAFWRAFANACRNLGHTTAEDREAYRREVMFEEAGKRHFADLERTGDFDKVMARFAADADDYEAASRFAVGDVGRVAFLVRTVCDQVMQLKGSPAGSTAARDYLAGVIGQARMPCGPDPHDPAFWQDMSQDDLRACFAILDTHRRRLLRHLMTGQEAFLGFDPNARYELLPTGGVRLAYATARRAP